MASIPDSAPGSSGQKIEFPFRDVKATQVAARFVEKNGGYFDHYLLAKCLYALDRRGLEKCGRPVIGGIYKNLTFGPVNQSALDMMQEARGFYSDHLNRSGNEVKLVSDPGHEQLSRVEMNLIDEIFAEWSSLNFNQAKLKIHELPESNDSEFVNRVLPVAEILRHLGKSAAEVQEIAEIAAASRQIQSLNP